MKKCALCGEEKELQKSHIIPKFVGKYLKSTSIGHIRSQENPNRVVQDIEKREMLCRECEELFSASETYFANTIFYPYMKDKRIIFDYDEMLFYFLTSLSWRSLYVDIEDFVADNNIEPDALEKMKSSEQIMKDFLLGKRQDLNDIEHHIFFIDRIMEENASDDTKLNIKHPNITIHRSVRSYSGYCGNTVYTITNLMGVIIVTLYSKDVNEIWCGTQVFNEKNRIIANNQKIMGILEDEISFWMKQNDNAAKEISNETKQKILKSIIDVGSSIKDYQIYQDILDDIQLKK